MTSIITIVLMLATLTTALGQDNSECTCNSSFQTVFRMIDKDSNKLLVCGHIKDSLADNSIEITSISVYDCSNKEIVLTYEYDEIISFTVTKYNDSIVFYNHHNVPIGDEWEMTRIPFIERTIKFINDTLNVSRGDLLFEYSDLSKTQTDSIKTICKILDSYKDKGRVMYPLDYETLYILFVGAFKDISNSRWTYEHLRENFEFDGAAAETLGEIHYEILMSSKIN